MAVVAPTMQHAVSSKLYLTTKNTLRCRSVSVSLMRSSREANDLYQRFFLYHRIHEEHSNAVPQWS